jgi:Tfp pilus assembly protein PilO
MSSRQLTRAFFPNPPAEYQQDTIAAIQEAYETLIRQLQNPGDERFTTLTLTNLQSGSDQGLEVGAIYEKEGFLKIALANEPNALGVSATGSVGSVTVSTP